MFLYVLVMPHTSQSWIAPDAILSYSVWGVGGDKNKKISQLIHLQAPKSHYIADEFKDCLRWKGPVCMARQSCVQSLLVSCGWKTEDMPTLQPTEYWTHPLNTTWSYIYLYICFLRGVMSYEVFIWWLPNEDRYSWWENWSDLSRCARDMNLSASTLLVWYRDTGSPNSGS